MATMAEMTRADAERKGTKPKRAKKQRQRKPKVHHEPIRAGKKATYAEEPTSPGKRPSRRSTRASKNRMKRDANLVRRADDAAVSPEFRAAKAKRRAKHPRGRGAGSASSA